MRARLLLAGLGLFLVACGSSGDSAAPPTTPPVTPPVTQAPTVVLVQGAAVGAGGGTVAVTKPGDPYDGLKITVKPGSFAAATQWTVARDTALRPALPAGFTQLGSALVVSNGQGYSDSLMQLTIPVRAGLDTALAAFYYNAATRSFELLPPAGRSADGLAVQVRHFSSDQLLAPVTAAGAAGRARVDLATTGTVAFGTVPIIVVALPRDSLARAVSTSFQPGRDDWEFTNNGVFPEPDGQCAGQSMTALWYHYAVSTSGGLGGTGGPLFNRFSDVPGFDDDNARGLRLAGVAQREMNWDGAVFFLRGLRVASGLSALPLDVLHYQSLVMAMRMSGLPQLLAISNDNIGHAVIAYQAANGTIGFADPNAPGLARTMSFANDAFQPFPFSARAGSGAEQINYVRVLGVTALLPVSRLASLWTEFQAKTIGNAIFPATTVEAYDRLNDDWRPITDTLQTTTGDLKVRLKCPGCTAGSGEDFGQVRIVDASGKQAPGVTTSGAGGSDAPLDPGTAKFGLSLADSPVAGTDPSFIDFRWITAARLPFELTPRDRTAPVDSLLSFSVTAGTLVTPSARFTWNFGDQTAPVVVTGSATVQHTYRAAGIYTYTVQLADARGRVLGKDQGTVNVGAQGPLSVWTMSDAYVTSSATPSAGDGSLQARRTASIFNGAVNYWLQVGKGAVPSTLWIYTAPANGSFPVQRMKAGVYRASGLPGSNGGNDPALDVVVNDPGPEPRGHADDPALDAFFTVADPDPQLRRVTGRFFDGTYPCLGENRFTVMNATELAVELDAGPSTTSAIATVTLTYRYASPGCAPYPRPETERGTTVIKVLLTRVR